VRLETLLNERFEEEEQHYFNMKAINPERRVFTISRELRLGFFGMILSSFFLFLVFRMRVGLDLIMILHWRNIKNRFND